MKQIENENNGIVPLNRNYLYRILHFGRMLDANHLTID
jgi:hypothetical protein